MNDRNPYADDGGYDELAGPERTSALAVVSLVMSLLCCIPGLGVLGAGLGVGALLGISGSRGRVGGKGLAVAGIIVGILVSVAWVGGYVAFQKGVGELLSKTGTIVGTLDSGDYDGFRGTSSSPASDLSDADYAAFVAAYRAQLGGYAGVPDSAWEYIQNFGNPTLAQSMQGSPPAQNAIPVTVEFDNGMTIVFLVASQTSGNPFSPIDLIYLLPDGSMIKLSDYLGAGGDRAVDPDQDTDSETDDQEPADPDGP